MYKPKKSTLVLIAFYILFHWFISPAVEYDHGRNLGIALCTSKYGLPCYFGQNFLNNPPLSYYLHALLIKLFGFHYQLHRMLDLAFFIAGIILVEIIGRRLKLENLELFVGLNWTFIYATAIRSYSELLFAGALIYLAYLELLEKDNWFFFGLASGLGLWFKYTLGVFSAVLSLVYFVKKRKVEPLAYAWAVILLLFSPLVLYSKLNGLPMPWKVSAKNQQIWRNSVPPPIYDPFVKIIVY